MGSWLNWIIWVRDLLSPPSNCLPLFHHLWPQSLTPWPWGMVRSFCKRHTKFEVQTMILTNTIIVSTTTSLSPPATPLSEPGTCHSASLLIQREAAYMEAYIKVILGVSCLLRVYLEVCLGVSFRASCEHTWKHRDKQARSVLLSAIKSVLESLRQSISESGCEYTI